MDLNSTTLRELELSIADRIYIKVGKWNLYLGDAGLAKALAIECQAHLDEDLNIAARKALEAVQVSLGDGKTQLPLISLVPPSQLFDLEDLLGPYGR